MLNLFRRTDVEECGILVSTDRGRTFVVVAMPNVHPDPSENFAIRRKDTTVWLKAHPDHELIGFVHTHLPDHPPGPSDTDIEEMQAFPDMWGAVLHVTTRTLTWFDHQGIVTKEKL